MSVHKLTHGSTLPRSNWKRLSTETTRLIRDGEKEGKGVWKDGKSEIIYLSLHCYHQNDSCIKMGSDESHFNVSLIVRDHVKRQVHKPQPF